MGQRNRNSEKGTRKRRKRLSHTMAGGRSLLARSSRSKNKVLASKDKEPGTRNGKQWNQTWDNLE